MFGPCTIGPRYEIRMHTSLIRRYGILAHIQLIDLDGELFLGRSTRGGGVPLSNDGGGGRVSR